MYLYERLQKEKEQQKRLRDIRSNKPKDDDMRYVTFLSGMSHTYGNALAFMEKYVLDIFPKDLFKTVHVHSKLAHRQIRSTNKEYLKKSKPMIIFRPRIASYDEDRFLKGTPIIEKQLDMMHQWGLGNLMPFFEDVDHKLSIKFQMNRSIMYVDVILIFSTLMQQIDYQHYLNNAVRWDQPYFIPIHMESFIPYEALTIISDIVNIPVYDANRSTHDFLQYMNQHSGYPITYKLNGGSGTREYFRYYPVNLETTFTGLSSDDGEMNSMVNSQYQITFSVKMEFNSTGFYYIFNNKLFDLKLPVVDAQETDIIPIYTDVILEEDLHLQQGWILYNRGSIQLEDPNEEIDLTPLLNTSINAAIDYHLKNGLPLCDLIDLKVRKQGELIREGKEYQLCWADRRIKFINQDSFHTFSFYACVNLEYINDLVKKVYGLE